MSELSGTHVLVTGGSEGIGRATALACVARGARVTVMARRTDRLAALREASPTVLTVSGDVTDEASLRTAANEAVRDHGPVDVLITCAGSARPGYVESLDLTVFRQQIELNHLGTVNAVRAVLPSMLERGRGHLVLTSSVAGLIGVFGHAAYAPAKFAVRGLGLALDAELRHRGISVSIAYPPDTFTPGFEQENRTKPLETARVSSAIPPVSAERVARAIVRGIERDRLGITADWRTAALVRLGDPFGPLIRAQMRRTLAA